MGIVGSHPRPRKSLDSRLHLKCPAPRVPGVRKKKKKHKSLRRGTGPSSYSPQQGWISPIPKKKVRVIRKGAFMDSENKIIQREIICWLGCELGAQQEAILNEKRSHALGENKPTAKKERKVECLEARCCGDIKTRQTHNFLHQETKKIALPREREKKSRRGLT